MNKDLHVCLIPIEITWGDKQANLDRLEQQLKAVHPDTDIVVLPETFTTGFPIDQDKEQVRAIAERNTGPTIDRIKELAHKYQVAIVGGFVADSGGSMYNRVFFIEPSGDEQFADKHHLFSIGGEDKVFSRGYDRMKVRFRGWNLAFVICYDIRFPVWCRNVMNEYDALIVIANWPDKRIDAWDKLLTARAIENQSYLCAVDCKGTDPKGYIYNGNASAIDFKGNDITVRKENPDLAYGCLSRQKLDDYRAKFPAWRDADTFKLV